MQCARSTPKNQVLHLLLVAVLVGHNGAGFSRGGYHLREDVAFVHAIRLVGGRERGGHAVQRRFQLGEKFLDPRCHARTSVRRFTSTRTTRCRRSASSGGSESMANPDSVSPSALSSTN